MTHKYFRLERDLIVASPILIIAVSTFCLLLIRTASVLCAARASPLESSHALARFPAVEVVELIWILWERWVRGSQLRIVSKKWFTTWVRRLGARAERRSQLKIVYEEFVYKLGKEAGIMSWITCTRSLKALNISLLYCYIIYYKIFQCTLKRNNILFDTLPLPLHHAHDRCV